LKFRKCRHLDTGTAKGRRPRIGLNSNPSAAPVPIKRGTGDRKGAVYPPTYVKGKSVTSAGASLEQAGKLEMEEAENPFVGRSVVARSARHPREKGTDGVVEAFKRGGKLARSAARPICS